MCCTGIQYFVNMGIEPGIVMIVTARPLPRDERSTPSEQHTRRVRKAKRSPFTVGARNSTHGEKP